MAKSCKFQKLRKYASYDGGITWSPLDEYKKGDLIERGALDCMGCPILYDWVEVDDDYICSGTTKYYKLQKYESLNCGKTYTAVVPSEYKQGPVMEEESEDCGYIPPIPRSRYLSFIALEDATFKFSGTSTANTLSYSLDEGETWVTLANNTYSPTVISGNKIMFKGNCVGGRNGIGRFYSTGRFSIDGNVMSLLFGDSFRGKTSLSGYVSPFSDLFYSNSYLIDASNMALPATELVYGCYANMFANCRNLELPPEELPATVVEDSAYQSMFDGCSKLRTAPVIKAETVKDYSCQSMFWECTALYSMPKLNAIELGEYCYDSMFGYCTSLRVVYKLPSTTLRDGCYNYMFQSCTSLTKAPELPATTLVDSCYYGMFNGCSNLSYIKCLAIDISASDSTYEWCDGVSANGTFVKNSATNWSRDISGIPVDWRVQNV